MDVYFGSFGGVEDIINGFCIPESELEGMKIIYAAYDCEYYEGYAHVIFLDNGTLYEAHGSHCSCNDLSDQWEPEETSVTALLARPNVSDQAKANLREYYKNLLAFL